MNFHGLPPKSDLEHTEFSSLRQLRKFVLLICCPWPIRVCLRFWHPFDLLVQPTGKSLFEFHLRAGPVEVIHRFSGFSQRNEPARRTLTSKRSGHKLHQWTLGAGMGPGGIVEIEAGRGILEDIGSPPRRAWRPPVATLLEKAQLELKYFEDVSVVSPHKAPTGGGCSPKVS